MTQKNQSQFKCGFISIIGRPNVGKSTLMNHLIGQKISITSKKAQTTRNSIRGIYTDLESQMIFIDTPGFQKIHINPLNQQLNENVKSSINNTDLILFIVEANKWTQEDDTVLSILPEKIPTVAVVNKMDKIKSKYELDLFVNTIKQQFHFSQLEVVSAKNGLRIGNLLSEIKTYLPEGIALYPDDSLTDKTNRFLAMEIIREKIFRYLGEELPYSMNVEIDSFKEEENIFRIYATVLVDKESQKGILIGKNGATLKKISTEARIDMEKLFNIKVFLKVWSKVKSGWAHDISFLNQLGL